MLRPGQIVQGEILKLYPNNKAQIQLGSKKMVAQLEASLTTDGKYHFQVQATEDVIHLKVLGKQLQTNLHTNVKYLLHQLGLKTTKPTQALVQDLIHEKIPFRKDQLVKAFRLLEGSENKLQAQQVLNEMIVHKHPMTATVFNALYTKETSGFTEQITSLLQQLKQDTNKTSLHQDISNQLRQLVERPLFNKEDLIKQAIAEVTNNNRQFLSLLKAGGMIESRVDLGSRKTQWEMPAKQSNLTGSNITNQGVSVLELPLKSNGADMRQMLERMIDNKAKLGSEAHGLIQKFGETIENTVKNNVPLSTQNFVALKQQIMQELLPLLVNAQQTELTTILQNNPPALQTLLTNLQTVAGDQIYLNMEQALTEIKQGETFKSMTLKEQFLAQVKQVLLFTGLTHENLVKQDVIQQQSTTVKSMLIQMVQQIDGTTKEHAQQLLHFINGLQLQSVNETSHFIQASLQIPGEKLALNSDLQLEIEGEKTEKGMINPEYCRVLFYLDLTNLQETIIDMHIQQRSVAITIFNDQERLQKDATFLQPMLKDGLAALDYHLTTVTIKPLQQNDKPKKSAALSPSQNVYQGVDYRI